MGAKLEVKLGAKLEAKLGATVTWSFGQHYRRKPGGKAGDKARSSVTLEAALQNVILYAKAKNPIKLKPVLGKRKTKIKSTAIPSTHEPEHS